MCNAPLYAYCGSPPAEAVIYVVSFEVKHDSEDQVVRGRCMQETSDCSSSTFRLEIHMLQVSLHPYGLSEAV